MLLPVTPSQVLILNQLTRHKTRNIAETDPAQPGRNRCFKPQRAKFARKATVRRGFGSGMAGMGIEEGGLFQPRIGLDAHGSNLLELSARISAHPAPSEVKNAFCPAESSQPRTRRTSRKSVSGTSALSPRPSEFCTLHSQLSP